MSTDDSHPRDAWQNSAMAEEAQTQPTPPPAPEPTPLVFEQPLNERMRTFLRLDFLYSQALYHNEMQSQWGSRAAMGSLLDILAIAARGDVRADVQKELERHLAQLNVFQSKPGVDSARLRTVMASLVRHLHDFAREVELTEDEWWRGIRFLTDAGHITDDKRQEFILLSDVLGLSTLVMAQNNSKPAGCTEATVFGPFFVEGAPMVEHGADIANGANWSTATPATAATTAASPRAGSSCALRISMVVMTFSSTS